MMNPAKSFNPVKTDSGQEARLNPFDLALRRPKALFFFRYFQLSLPFESFKNREHPMPPDRIKVGSARAGH